MWKDEKRKEIDWKQWRGVSKHQNIKMLPRSYRSQKSVFAILCKCDAFDELSHRLIVTYPLFQCRLISDVWKQYCCIGRVHGLQLGTCRLQFGRTAHRWLWPQKQKYAIVARTHGYSDRFTFFTVSRWSSGHRITRLSSKCWFEWWL